MVGPMGRQLSDFEETVEYPVDEVTELSTAPSAVQAYYVPVSHSLIADAEAIIAAYQQRPGPQLTWAQRMRAQAAAPAQTSNEKSRLLRATDAVLDFADQVGAAVMDAAISVYRRIQRSKLGRRLRSRHSR